MATRCVHGPKSCVRYICGAGNDGILSMPMLRTMNSFHSHCPGSALYIGEGKRRVQRLDYVNSGWVICCRHCYYCHTLGDKASTFSPNPTSSTNRSVILLL